MKTNLKTDEEILTQAIEFAKNRGYFVPALEYAMFVKGSDNLVLNSSLRMWAIGLIYSESFLKAFFGERLVPREEDYDTMMAITLWAQQVAFEHEGRLYAADRNNQYMHFPIYDEVDYVSKWAAKAPAELMHTRVVTKKLQDMSASLAVNTHKIKKVRVDNLTPDIPEYKHHMKRMVDYDNPFLYLKNYMAYNSSPKD